MTQSAMSKTRPSFEPEPEELDVELDDELEDELYEVLEEELSPPLDESLILELPLDEVDRELWFDDELGRWGFSKRSSAPPAWAATEKVESSAMTAIRTDRGRSKLRSAQPQMKLADPRDGENAGSRAVKSVRHSSPGHAGSSMRCTILWMRCGMRWWCPECLPGYSSKA
jgi:hypothetical protein